MMFGSPVEEQFSLTIRQKIKQLLGILTEKDFRFISSLPTYISANDNLAELLENNDYLISRKGVGLRAMLLLHVTSEGPAAFLFTADNNLWYNPMKFPQPTNYHIDQNDCLIDGELIVSKPSNPTERPVVTFKAFDLIAIGGTSVTRRSLSTRLGILKSDIIDPRIKYVNTQTITPPPFHIEMCVYERSYGIQRTLAEPGLKSLIFTPVKTMYTLNRSKDSLTPYLFQWTLPEHNCVAFKLSVKWDSTLKPQYQLFVSQSKYHKYFDDFTPTDELLKEWKTSAPDGKIIDCRYDKDWETLIQENGYAAMTRKGGWKFVRFRPELKLAEEEWTLKERWNSFINPVPIEAFNNSAEIVRKNWKNREMQLAGFKAQIISTSELHQVSPNSPENKRKSFTGSITTSPTKKSRIDPSDIERSEEDEEEEVITSGYVQSLGIDISRQSSGKEFNDFYEDGKVTPASLLRRKSSSVLQSPNPHISHNSPFVSPMRSKSPIIHALGSISEDSEKMSKTFEKSLLVKVEPVIFVPGLPKAANMIQTKQVTVKDTNNYDEEESQEESIEDFASARYAEPKKIPSVLEMIELTETSPVIITKTPANSPAITSPITTGSFTQVFSPTDEASKKKNGFWDVI